MNANLEMIYIPNNSYKAEYENEDNGDKNGYDLMYDKYLFYKHRKNKDSINWLCKDKKCRASITINSNGSILRSNLQHSGEDHKVQELTLLGLEFAHTV